MEYYEETLFFFFFLSIQPSISQSFEFIYLLQFIWLSLKEPSKFSQPNMVKGFF